MYRMYVRAAKPIAMITNKRGDDRATMRMYERPCRRERELEDRVFYCNEKDYYNSPLVPRAASNIRIFM